MSTKKQEFNWVRSIGPGDIRDLVRMTYKGRHRVNNDEGLRGDVMCRPSHLGDGEYTVTVGFQDCETLDGREFTQNWPNESELQMTTKTKPPKRKAGRPTLASLGIAPRIRRNFNMERDAQFDRDLRKTQESIAGSRLLPVSAISQAEAIKIALALYAEWATGKQGVVCEKCNGIGYTRVQSGDDDVPCTCSPKKDGEIPF